MWHDPAVEHFKQISISRMFQFLFRRKNLWQVCCCVFGRVQGGIGMDWLSSYRVQIDCGKGRLLFGRRNPLGTLVFEEEFCLMGGQKCSNSPEGISQDR